MRIAVWKLCIPLLVGLGLTACLAPRAAANPSPFYMGADISLQPFMEGQYPTVAQPPRATFYHNVNGNSVAAPLDQILYDHGANLFRLRIFVNPATNYINSGPNVNYGAIQSQAYDIALAQEIKSHCPNAKILLDFMYSDYWADPGQQTKPAAWTNIPLVDPVNHNDLTTKIKSYTQSTLQAFGAAGVMPDVVQVGNEISSGLLWGTGTGANSQGGGLNFSGSTTQQQTSWQNLGTLLNSAIQGVRAAQGAGPKINVVVHIDQGDQDGHPQYYFGNLTNPTWGNVSDFDTIGVSYYPSTRASHSLALLQSNLNAVADAYPTKKVLIAEVNYPWENAPSLTVPDWAATPAGQQQFMTDTLNVIRNIHNGAGLGMVWWYPEAVNVPNFDIYNGGATALFDNNHVVLPAVNTFGVTLLAGDYDHNGVVDASDYVIWRQTLGSTTDLRANGDNLGASAGIIDQADYDYWASHYGTAASGAAAASATVPEPSTWILLATAAVLAFGKRRHRHCDSVR